MGGAVGQIGHSQYQELDKMSSANPTGEDEEWISNPLKRVTMNADKVEDVVDKDHGREELLSATTKARMLTKVHKDDYIHVQVLWSWQAIIIPRLA